MFLRFYYPQYHSEKETQEFLGVIRSKKVAISQISNPILLLVDRLIHEDNKTKDICLEIAQSLFNLALPPETQNISFNNIRAVRWLAYIDNKTNGCYDKRYKDMKDLGLLLEEIHYCIIKQDKSKAKEILATFDEEAATYYPDSRWLIIDNKHAEVFRAAISNTNLECNPKQHGPYWYICDNLRKKNKSIP